MVVIFLFAGIILGFFLPGYFINRILGGKNDFGADFIVSTVILFTVIFWAGISGFKLNVVNIGLLLLLLNALLFVYCSIKRKKLDMEYQVLRLGNFERVILLPIALLCLLMLLRSSFFPLPIGDQIFRWYFLPARMLETGSFSYYPPFTGADYEKYFFTDSFPPIVSFSYFWLFSLYGKAEVLLVCIPVTIQFALIFVFGYRLASTLFNSEKAGFFAILMIGSSTLLFYSVLLSQETGITALATLALVYFLVRNRECTTGDVLLAAFASALGALSREYGCVFILCGLIVILWRKMPLRILVCYLTLSFLLVGPWYIRNIIITGNPVYSNPIGNIFPVNPVHVGILSAYSDTIGLKSYMNINVLKPLAEGLVFALGIPFFIGVAAVLMMFRKLGYLLLISIIFLSLWIYSIFVPAGIFHSMRILTPAIALLYVCAASIFDMLSAKYKNFYRIAAIVLSASCFLALFLDIFVPWNPFRLSLKEWEIASGIKKQWDISQEIYLFIEPIPNGSKVLSDCANFYAVLEADKENSKDIKLVSVYSPDVRFLFDKNTSFEEGAAGLKKLGISYVLIGQKNNLDFIYFRKFPFFEKCSSSGRQIIKGLLYELPSD